MSRLQITLKSGAQIEASCRSYEYTRSRVGKHFSWTDGDDGDRLVAVDMDEVAAIVEVKP